MNKAIFLDRDGTILKEILPMNNDKESLGYLLNVEQVELINRSDEAISLANRLGFFTIIITNQSAFARGWLDEDTFYEINKKMYDLLSDKFPDAKIDDLFYSPYHIDGVIENFAKESDLRKPGIGMINLAIKKHNIDLSCSYFIGDSYSDMKCAQNSGLSKILVKTGYGLFAYKKCLDENLKIDFIADDLFDAVNWIKKNEIKSI